MGHRKSRLTLARERAGYSEAALADKARTTQPQIHRLEHGDRKLTREWAERLAPCLGISAEDLLFDVRTVPLLGIIEQGAKLRFYRTDKRGAKVRSPRGATEETVAVHIKGDILGTGLDGWLMYYDDDKRQPDEATLGKLCVVCSGNGDVMVRIVYRGRAAGLFDLHHIYGGQPAHDQQVAWVARITAIMPPGDNLDD